MKRILILSIAGMMMLGAQAFADNTCGENCTWEIVDGELKIHGTGNMNNYGYGTAPWYGQSNIQKITVGEGITSVSTCAFYQIKAKEVQLPSTIKSIGRDSFREMALTKPVVLPEGLETISQYVLVYLPGPVEIPASVKYVEGWCNGNSDLIINANENLQFGENTFDGWGNSLISNLNIQCKGEISICENMLTKIKKRQENRGGSLNLSYYEGLDKNGNWVEYSDDGLAVYTDSTKTKPLGTYDFDGNQTGLYEYDRGGNLIKAVENGVEIYRRRIYTPAEATAAVQDNKNTFKLNYR